jgi:hypothetical protein
MEHYVTVFDSLFLPQGLALHMSMERHADAYTLWIMCVDSACFDALTTVNLPHVRLLQVGKLETEALVAVKPTRSIGEYCWTLTPFAPRFVFEADSDIARVTYLDADVWLRKKPGPIFREFEASGKRVLITDHAYAPEYDQSATSGQYCVQFTTFTRNSGEIVRKWWEDRCIEWCYARSEDGKFGDQKYLDDWPEMFSDYVHVLSNSDLILAPWNATRFPYGRSVAWHFHGLRLINGWRKNSFIVDYGDYPLPNAVVKNVYMPYTSDLSNSVQMLLDIGLSIRPQKHKRENWIFRLLKGVRRNYWQVGSSTIGPLLPAARNSHLHVPGALK